MSKITFMDKIIPTFPISSTSKLPADITDSLSMEQEFEKELALLKQEQLFPRPEAVSRILKKAKGRTTAVTGHS